MRAKRAEIVILCLICFKNCQNTSAWQFSYEKYIISDPAISDIWYCVPLIAKQVHCPPGLTPMPGSTYERVTQFLLPHDKIGWAMRSYVFSFLLFFLFPLFFFSVPLLFPFPPPSPHHIVRGNFPSAPCALRLPQGIMWRGKECQLKMKNI